MRLPQLDQHKVFRHPEPLREKAAAGLIIRSRRKSNRSYWAETAETHRTATGVNVVVAVEDFAVGALLASAEATGLTGVATSVEHVAGCTRWLCMGAECTGLG